VSIVQWGIVDFPRDNRHVWHLSDYYSDPRSHRGIPIFHRRAKWSKKGRRSPSLRSYTTLRMYDSLCFFTVMI